MPRENATCDTLIEFLRTGMLGNIQLGMPAQAVRHHLGDPDDIANKENIWLYGSQSITNLQLPMVDGCVNGIWVYFWGSTDASTIPHQMNGSAWLINGRTTIDEFARLMNDHVIQWKTHDRLTFDDQTCMLLQSNVLCFWSHVPLLELRKITLTNGRSDWPAATEIVA